MIKWIGSLVHIIGWPEALWLCTRRLPDGWYEIIPKNVEAKGLANLSPTGKLWIRARDITRHNQQESLL